LKRECCGKYLDRNKTEKLPDEELHNLYTSVNDIRMNNSTMEGTCSRLGMGEMRYTSKIIV
jgi:hypothetical protein